MQGCGKIRACAKITFSISFLNIKFNTRRNEMELRDFLHFERMTQEQFGKLIGLTTGYVCRIANKNVKVTKRTARDIERETGGKVTAKELIEGYKNKVDDKAVSA